MLKKSSGTVSSGNLSFLCLCHSSNTFRAHFVDLPVLAGIKPLENSSNVSSSANSNHPYVDGCGSHLLVDGRWSWA